MTTATASKAPTEAEIGKALAAKAPDSTDKFHEAIDGYLDVLGYIEDGEHANDDPPRLVQSALWTDLRPSEAQRLRVLIRAARVKALTAAHDTILREATAAALQFAAEYPDAPRAVQEPSGAAISGK